MSRQTFPLQIDNLPMIRRCVAAHSLHLYPAVYDDSKLIALPVPMFEVPETLDVNPETGEIASNGFWVKCPSWTAQTEQPTHWIRVSHPYLAYDGGNASVAAWCPCSCQDRTFRGKGRTTLPGDHCKHQRAFIAQIWPSVCWHLLDSAKRQIALGMEAA